MITHRRSLFFRQLICCITFLCLFLASSGSLSAAGKFHSRVFKDKSGSHKYSVYTPDGYSSEKDAKKRWPVVLFLHGAGERGTDGIAPTKVGLGAILRQGTVQFPFIAVFPQCENLKSRYLTGWLAETNDAKRALKILEEVEKDFRVDTRHRILTGWSMGGYGVWSLAASTPQMWAGIVPVSGGGDAKLAPRLKSVPIWAFHGERDRAVKPSESKEMVAAIRKAGGKARLTIVSNAGHDVWKIVYANPALIAWMKNPQRTNKTDDVDLLVQPGNRPVKTADETAPFVPAVEISRAAYLRLGNDALKSLAYSVPSMVPPKMLTGRIGDLYDTTVTSGRTFNVQFSGIGYRGSVERAYLQAVGKGRLRIQLGLKNVTLTISRTYVTGESRSAVAGAIHIVIGHRQPVWLSVDVQPYLNKRAIRLKLLNRSFQIPNGNWYVTSPAGVSTRGLGMTREKVSSGLVSGLYGSKARIEREVLAIVPKMVRELEQKLVLTDVSDVVNGFWPLPVYRPRLRVWPERIQTDERGITVLLGVTAAAIDPQKAPRVPRRISIAEAGVDDDALQGKKLQVGLAPGVLKPLMQLLNDANVARIHVLDIPEKKFAPLADPVALSQAIPALKELGNNVEIWSELILVKPLTVSVPENTSINTKASAKSNSEDSQKTSGQILKFQLPELALSLAVRPKSSSSEWKPLAEFRISMTQDARVILDRPNFVERTLRLEWVGDPQTKITGRFAASYQPKNRTLDTQKIRKMFLAGWRAWTESGPATQVQIPDLNFGQSGLRANQIHWKPPYLTVELSNPGIKISNRTEKPLVYQTKGPYSKWSAPITLKPNEDHEFDIPYAMIFRSEVNGREMLFTLPAGSHSVYRKPKAGGAPRLFNAVPAVSGKKSRK
ncbi:MAG: hypothetical protein Tsb009_32080 [Planctomycetaceae bacterium]